MPLRDFPLSGAAREPFASGLRVVLHGAYALYYKPQTDAVVIIRGCMGRAMPRRSRHAVGSIHDLRPCTGLDGRAERGGADWAARPAGSACGMRD
jgi:hypothetical protein